MWAGETGQDNLGDDFPPEEINLIERGKHYGFPFFVADNRPNTGQPELAAATPDVTAVDAVPPALNLPAHASPIDLRFYRGSVFPPSYRNALFVALHGSARKNNGYSIVRVVMRDGRPVAIEDFATGFLRDGVVYGRPAGLATGPDGALYISDDNKGFIYRIGYDEKMIHNEREAFRLR
jgi:glucose/arabinose dehydrogenase